jgi:asparagine synthase (glutamine-hydrolysing)
MCGFAGVVAWDDRYRVSRETLGRMSASIAHRGPDGEGYHINREGEVTAERPQVALAFRRLAILDPDPRSNQPFTDGKHWLVFNGEIYNFRELRKELETADPAYGWRTSGDTEVLLRSYAVWGEKCVDRLNGMFAFALWDEAKKTLFLARDRMGQKPLYVAAKDGAIAFASEVPALRPLTWIDWTPWEEALPRYLRYGYTDRFYNGCFQHPPGFTRTEPVGGAGYQRRYFHPEMPSPDDRPRGKDARSLVSDAVARQLVSDVPLGVFLSGGVDSSVIACAARQHGPVQTFSIGFGDPRYDESKYAEEVAKHLGTQHHVFHVRPDAAADLPKLAAVFGEPFADSSALPTHYLARETRRHVKVALSGDGGDELFGGYDRYRAMQLGGRLRILAPFSAVGRKLARGHPKSKLTRGGRLLASLALSPGMRYDAYVRIFDDATLSALLREPLPTPEVAALFDIECRRYHDPVRAAAATDRAMYLPDDLLAKVDRASMLHALEVRSPFMDPDVVRYAATLTTDQLIGGGPKRMLREAFAADLPDFVFKRKKMGFAVPIGEWFRDELRPMPRDYLFASDSFARQQFDMAVVERLVAEHEQSRVDHSQRLYALLMLELWWKQSVR